MALASHLKVVYGARMAYDEKQDQVRFNKLKAVEKEKKLRLDQFVSKSMATPEGREYFYWLLEICHLHRNPFTSNALSTSFQCGELNVGQQVQAHVVEIAPANWLQMLQSKYEEQIDDNRSES